MLPQNYPHRLQHHSLLMVSISPDDQPQAQQPMDGFTAESASKLLPLVERIVREMNELHDSMDLHREQLRGLDEISQPIEGEAYEDEVEDVRRSFVEMEQQFESCRAELTALGLEPHQPFDGSVDFPATRDRRRISLCWRLGEDRVTHWHEISEGESNRQQLEPDVVSGAAV